jgi:hypothetical protein
MEPPPLMRCETKAGYLPVPAKRVICSLVLTLVACIGAGSMLAHTTSISYSEIQIKEKTVQVRLRLNLYEVSFAAQLDANSDRILSEAEVSSSFPKWAYRLFDNFQVEGQGQPGSPSLSGFKYMQETGALECVLSYSFSQPLQDVRFKVTLHNLTDSGHLNLAVIQHDSRQEQRFFNLENDEVRIEVHHGSVSFLKLCAEWLLTGASRVVKSYECLAFLLGLFLANQSSRYEKRAILAFVLAQTIAFIAGAFELATLPQRFVGSAIALSVVYISLENLLIKEVSNRWLIALFFGFIYGFSFSSGVTEWGLSQNDRLFPLLTIALGIAIAVSFVVFFISLLLRPLSYLPLFKRFANLTSVMLMGIGFLEFARRTF